MAIKGGQIIHDASGFVIDRIQQAGVNNLNIPQTKIYELGNYQSVATIRDIPDLSFQVQSLDVSTEIEALVNGVAPSSLSTGDHISFDNSIPMDILSPFKGYGAYNVVKGVVVPYLTLEQVQYRFGTTSNAEETFTFKGDSIYYVPGTPKAQKITLVNNTLTYNLADTALPYVEAGSTMYVLSACVKNVSTNKFKRLFFGADFTNTSSSITLAKDHFDDGYTTLHVTYGTAAAATYDQTVHEGVSVKPAAVRGKDIDVYITSVGATPTLIRWSGVQSFDVNRKVTLTNDEEFGNYHYVASSYDTADVTGTITVKPLDDDDLFDKIRQVANINSSTAVIGPYTSAPLAMELRVNNPDTATRIKTLSIPDARFTIPNIQGSANQQLSVTFNFQSDTGVLDVYKGAKP